MNRILLAALSTLSVVVLLFGYRTSTAGPEATGTSVAAPAISGSSPSAGASSRAATSSGAGTDPGTGSSGSAGDTPSDSSSGTTASGTTATGSVAQTRWGPVQVELTLSGTKITDVSVLQYPSGNPRDVEINDQALPILIQETKDAQSADIDMVSGATVTSDGYLTSLQSALDQANL